MLSDSPDRRPLEGSHPQTREVARGWGRGGGQ